MHAAKGVDSGIGECIQCGAICHIGRDGNRLPTTSDDLVGDTLHPIDVSCRHHDRSAGCGQALGDTLADSLAADGAWGRGAAG